MLHGSQHSKRHLLCREDLGDENREWNASHGVLGLGSLQHHVIDDCGEIDLRPLNDVVYEVGYLEGEIIPVSRQNEISRRTHAHRT